MFNVHIYSELLCVLTIYILKCAYLHNYFLPFSVKFKFKKTKPLLKIMCDVYSLCFNERSTSINTLCYCVKY